jgi:hypothetical protein
MFKRKTEGYNILCFLPDALHPFMILLSRGDTKVIEEMLKTVIRLEHSSQSEFHQRIREQIEKEFGDDADEIEIQILRVNDRPILIASRINDIKMFLNSLSLGNTIDEGQFFVEGPDTIQ